MRCILTELGRFRSRVSTRVGPQLGSAYRRRFATYLDESVVRLLELRALFFLNGLAQLCILFEEHALRSCFSALLHLLPLILFDRSLDLHGFSVFVLRK